MIRHCFRIKHCSRWTVAGSLLAGIVLLHATQARAIEPAKAFLEGLREKGYYDVAIDYLDAAAKNPAVPADFKQTLLYERGITLVDGAKANRDPALREKQLDDGQATLEKFIASNPQSILIISARSQLGNVVVERARARMKKSEKATAAQKSQLWTEARGFYSQALTVFQELSTEIATKLKAYPAAIDEKKEAKKHEEREQFRKDYLQAELLAAATREEMAETYEAGVKDRNTALETAAKEYGEIYDKYRTRLAGLYARMYQARCLQKLGKHKDALGYFVELLANPDQPEPFRVLRIKVTELAIPSWIDQKLYLEVIDKSKEKRAMQLVESARPAEDKSEEFMSMRLGIARAMKLQVDELKTKDPKDANIRKGMQEGRKLVLYVTKFPGPHQEEARRMLSDFGPADGTVQGDKPDPKDFAEARKAGKEAIDLMQESNTLIKDLPERMKTVKDPAERAEMQKQIADAQKQSTTSKDDAVRYLKMAIAFSTPETDVGELNLVRYLLCYLAYANANYHEAAVLGDFIARRYPDSQGARQCAKITMASYIKLYSEKDPKNPEENKEFEAKQIIAICKYISEKWPDSPEAAEAINTLIPFMIKEKRLDDAQAYLDQIPKDAPARGPAELKIGQSLWAAFLEGSRELRDYENAEIKPEGFDPVKKKAELESLKTKAKTILTDGVTRMQSSGEVSAITVTSTFSLAQIYVNTNEPGKAVAILEDPKIGALTLTKKDDPVTQREGFQQETFKLALQAYISSLSVAGITAETTNATIQKAEEIMGLLEKLMATDEKGQSKLIGIYVSLAKELQKQMELADPASKVALGKGFEAFLAQMSKKSQDMKILNWVAETYRGMGESFGPVSKGITPEAKKYFDEAVVTYQRIIEMAKKDPKAIPPAMVTSLKLQVARTNRATGKYKEAMDLFDEILKAQNMLLPVQVEAAKTYQDWGAMKGDKMEDNYQRAIFGAREVTDAKTKQKKNNIWGWAQLAKVVGSRPEYKDIFHEARYNLALARYAYAMKKKDAEQKTQLSYAKRDIAVMYGFYPDLGGDKWKPQYEALLKNIQIGLGERPLGLAALKQAEPSSSPDSATTPKAGATPTKTTAPATTPTKAATPAKTTPPATKTSAPAKS